MTLKIGSPAFGMRLGLTCVLGGLAPLSEATAQTSPAPWYTQGAFAPTERVAITIVNDLPVDRVNNPVVITPEQLPMLRGAHELTITLVDPARAPRPEPTRRERA